MSTKFKFLGSTASVAIGKLITTAVGHAKKAAPAIHEALMQTAALAIDPSRGGEGSGDTTLLDRLLRELQAANYPMSGIRSWIVGNYPIRVSADEENGFKLVLVKPNAEGFIKPDFEAANNRPFWEYAPDRVNNGVDPATFLETAQRTAKRLQNLVDNTDVDGDGNLGPMDITKPYLRGNRASLAAAIDYVNALTGVAKPKLAVVEDAPTKIEMPQASAPVVDRKEATPKAA